MFNTNAVTLSTLAQLVTKRLSSAEKLSYHGEASWFAGELGDERARVSQQTTPLWSVLGWAQAELNLPNWGELMREAGGEEKYARLFEEATQPYSGIIGKGNVGIYPTEHSVRFDLGAAAWRAIDFVRAGTLRPHNPYLLAVQGVTPLKSDDDLGDGVFARVRPETIGYERELGPKDDTFLQCRAYVYNRERTAVVKVFKGLLHVGHFKQEFYSPAAGYGDNHVMSARDVIEIHPMLDVRDYNPRGRVSDQLLSYSGAEGCFAKYQAGVNIDLDERFDGARMMLAGSPIGNLPVTEAMRVMGDVLGKIGTIEQGVRRKVAPGLKLSPFTFRAPYELSGVFVVGQRYAVHRDPAMPDGSSTWSGTCVGYTRGNYFEVPTASAPQNKGVTQGVWEQGGGDFDGDDALVLPHVSNGGVVLGFNDRPQAEQDELTLAAGAAGRKTAGFKKQVYADGKARWAEQRKAVIELGLLDMLARKLLDVSPKGGKTQAAALKPWVQAAVDRQKRMLPYPGDWSSLPKLRGSYATTLLSNFKKPESEASADKTHWHHSWNLLMAKRTYAEWLLDESVIMSDAKRRGLKNVIRWALSVFDQVERQLINTSGELYQQTGYPRANAMPRLQLAEFTTQRRGEVSEAAQQLIELEAELLKLAKAHPQASNVAVQLLRAALSGYEVAEQSELCFHLTSPQLWLKVAPMSDLSEFFAQPTFNQPSADKLGGVIIHGRGKAFKEQGNKYISTRRMMVAGVSYAAGEVVITAHHREKCLTLSICGQELARVPGNANNFDLLARELLSAPQQVTGEQLDALLAEQESHFQLAEFAQQDLELLEMWARACLKARELGSSDQQRLVWLAIGDELVRLGVSYQL